MQSGRHRSDTRDPERYRKRESAKEVRKAVCFEARPVDTVIAIERIVNPEWRVEIALDALLAGRAQPPLPSGGAERPGRSAQRRGYSAAQPDTAFTSRNSLIP